MTTARNALTQSYQRTGLGLYCARLRVPRRGGARPSVGPLHGLPVFQRPLQEDLSRSAENLPGPKVPSCHETAAGTIWWPVGAAWRARRPSEGGSTNKVLKM